MAQQIWKFPLSRLVHTNAVRTHKGVKFLDVQTQDGKWVVWGIVDTSKPLTTLLIERFGTGWDMPELQSNEERTYLATMQEGLLVWHLFVREKKSLDTVTPDPADRTVTVLIKHECGLPGFYWCELVYAAPSNVFVGHFYSNSWKCWVVENPSPATNLLCGTFGIGIRGSYSIGEKVVVPLSELRVIKCGEPEDVGPVTID